MSTDVLYRGSEFTVPSPGATNWGSQMSLFLNALSRAPGVLSVNTAAVGNVNAGEDTLMSYTLAASSLLLNGAAQVGRGVRITAWGYVANNGNAKTLKAKFGSTTMLSASLATGGAYRWYLVALVFVKTGGSAERYFVKIDTNGNPPHIFADGDMSETLSNANAITFTGEATATNDIVQDGLLVEFL